MKKIIALLLVFTIVLSMVACDNRSQMEKDYDNAKSKISGIFNKN